MGIIETLDGLTTFITDGWNYVKDFVTNMIDMINQIINILPKNLKSIFTLAMLIIPILILYNFIWGHK